jgi:hypothetical protein
MNREEVLQIVREELAAREAAEYQLTVSSVEFGELKNDLVNAFKVISDKRYPNHNTAVSNEIDARIAKLVKRGCFLGHPRWDGERTTLIQILSNNI